MSSAARAPSPRSPHQERSEQPCPTPPGSAGGVGQAAPAQAGGRGGLPPPNGPQKPARRAVSRCARRQRTPRDVSSSSCTFPPLRHSPVPVIPHFPSFVPFRHFCAFRRSRLSVIPAPPVVRPLPSFPTVRHSCAFRHSPLSATPPFPSFLRRQESMRPPSGGLHSTIPAGPPNRPIAPSRFRRAVEHLERSRRASYRMDSCLRRNDEGVRRRDGGVRRACPWLEQGSDGEWARVDGQIAPTTSGSRIRVNKSDPLSPRTAGGDAEGRGGPPRCEGESPPLSLRDISPRTAGGE